MPKPVIDMQHHYVSSSALQLVGKTPDIDFTIGLQKLAKAYEIMVDADTHLRWMDECGIERAILSQAVFCENGHEFCRRCNDGNADLIKRYPDRFSGMIHIYPLGDAGQNREEITRAVEELALWGIAVVSSLKNMKIDSSVMDHIYEMATRYDMPIFVHPTIRKGIWGEDSYNIETTLAREYEIAKSFLEILYGVIPRFPELKVVMAHFGGGIPSLKGRLLSWHKTEESTLTELDRKLGIAVDHAVELGLVEDFERRLKNVYFDCAGYGGWSPVINAAFEAIGSDHLCFGTDYPYELREPRYVRKMLYRINEMSYPEKEIEKFLRGNLKELFKLPGE